MSRFESGATLIYVLFVLLALSIIAAYTARQSSSDLAVLTTGQSSDLLFQGSELALAKIEEDSRSDAGSLSPGRFRGYVLRDGMEGREVVFCLRPLSGQLFSLSSVTERLKTGGIVNGLNNGYCDLGSDGFVNQRQSAVTQVTAEKVIPPSCRSEAFACEADRTAADAFITSGNENAIATAYIDVNATTVLPGYGETNDIEGCLKGLSSNLQNCLNGKNIPSQTHFQRYESYVRGFDPLSQ